MSLALSNLRSRDRFNIVEPGRLHPAVSFARASTATFIGPDGLMQIAAANQPRYEYDAAGNYLGLLMEESRNNTIIRSTDYTNAVWIKNSSGSGTVPVVTPAAGIAPDGSNTAQRIVFDRGMGTATTDYSILEQAQVTVANTQYGQAIWLKSFDSNSYTLSFSYAGLNVQVITITPQWQRFVVYATATDTVRGFRLDARGSSGTSQKVDVLAWNSQREVGTFVTSDILTTTAAVTRASDVCQVTNASLPKIRYGAAAGTIIAVADSLTNTFGLNVCLASFDDNTANNRIMMRRDTTNYYLTCQVVLGSTSQQSNPPVGSWPQTDLAGHRIAMFWDATGNACAFDGNVYTRYVAQAVPVCTQMQIGYGPNSQRWNGHIKSLIYVPYRVQLADLGRLTA